MRRNKGFTLIEVLIVVIILGILATLAVPQFGKMRKRARLAEGWAGLGAVRTAEAVYYMEQDNYAIVITDLDFDTPAGGGFSYTVSGPAGGASYSGYAQGHTTDTDFSGANAWIFSDGTRCSQIQ